MSSPSERLAFSRDETSVDPSARSSITPTQSLDSIVRGRALSQAIHVVAAKTLAEAAFDLAFGLEVALLQHVRAGCEAEHVLGVGAFLVAMSLVVGGRLAFMSLGSLGRGSARAWRIVGVPGLMGERWGGKEQSGTDNCECR